MFCYKCGTKLKDDDTFCYKCGAEVKQNNDNEYFVKSKTNSTMEEISNSTNENIDKNQQDFCSKLARKRPFKFLPIISILFVFILNLGWYIYENRVTAKVENVREKAEELALRGKIFDASNMIDKAVALRPNNRTLQVDKKFLEDGKNIEKNMKKVDDYVKKHEYSKALSELDNTNKYIKDNKGAFYEFLKKNIKNKKIGVTVLNIKKEMNNKNSIEELGALVSKISSYNVKEAKDTVKALEKKISNVAYNNANGFLRKNDFSTAQLVIEKGLKYCSNDKKLLSFKDTIIKRKKDFERAEKNRIEQAMVQAAQEDKNNKTNAVQVISTNTYLNEYGDCVITGKVKNIATTSIYSIGVKYIVYDENNNKLGINYAYVYPDY